MHHAYSTRGLTLATLMFCIPLAIVGFQAAAWWGVVAGVLVGAVIASRMLLRGASDPAAVHAPTLIVTGDLTSAAAGPDSRIAPRNPVLH